MRLRPVTLALILLGSALPLGQACAAGAAAGRFAISGGTDRASVMLAASTILDMCVHSTEWLREDGPLSVSELQDRYVVMALRIVGADPEERPPPGVEGRPGSHRDVPSPAGAG